MLRSVNININKEEQRRMALMGIDLDKDTLNYLCLDYHTRYTSPAGAAPSISQLPRIRQSDGESSIAIVTYYNQGLRDSSIR